ncbi:protein NEGATIVE REGULATOR OF RESISTANCE-like isoform X2 [Hibiscus syriacus]|uniref:protein NEGATIVE REGULATOR OF RESISTANCE-like isoform X2 n=1 Tax=Hibiscus syriacus TaxID=106335 RepID=UPI001923D5D4|nr:protein NEGATIVE REGULATOR OF RESISTANCE-like isoform X2 [Hibiscus syriacus]
MESEKRKRKRRDDGKRAKEGEPAAVAEEEEEVEEFFAILKRIRVAVKYFDKAEAGGSEVKVTGKPWRPRFVWEDFDGDKNQEDCEEDTGFDLNLKPDVSKPEN